MTNRYVSFAICALTFLIFGASFQISAAPKPLRVLLITGGCCHDYRKQKDILKQGLEERASLTLDQIHTDDTSTHPPLAILGNPDYAKGFQLSKQVKNKHSKPRRSWIWQHRVLVEDKHKEKYWICCCCEYIYIYINSFTLTIQQVTMLEPNL